MGKDLLLLKYLEEANNSEKDVQRKSSSTQDRWPNSSAKSGTSSSQNHYKDGKQSVASTKRNS